MLKVKYVSCHIFHLLSNCLFCSKHILVHFFFKKVMKHLHGQNCLYQSSNALASLNIWWFAHKSLRMQTSIYVSAIRRRISSSQNRFEYQSIYCHLVLVTQIILIYFPHTSKFIAHSKSIQDVIFFPQMRPK